MGLNLAEMAEGAFLERFHIELEKALENIADPNTDPKKARKITLTATLKADEKRDIINFEVQVEVEQPESKFVFRMRKGVDGPEAALFEADGGAWKIEAMKRIKEYLEGQLQGTDVKIIA